MVELPNPTKRVNYAVYRDHCKVLVPTWDKTDLGYFWNQIKSYYLPGQIVTIVDNNGYSKTFIRGIKG